MELAVDKDTYAPIRIVPCPGCTHILWRFTARVKRALGRQHGICPHCAGSGILLIHKRSVFAEYLVTRIESRRLN